MTKNGVYHFYPSAKSRRELKIKTSGLILQVRRIYLISLPRPEAGNTNWGVLGAIGEPFANAFGNQQFVFVSFSFLLFPYRRRLGEGKKRFSFKIPFKINRLMSTAGSETPGRRKKIGFSIENPVKINRFLSVAGSDPARRRKNAFQLKFQAKMNDFPSVAGSQTARRRKRTILTVPSRNLIFDARALSSRAAPISPYRRELQCP